MSPLINRALNRIINLMRKKQKIIVDKGTPKREENIKMSSWGSFFVLPHRSQKCFEEFSFDDLMQILLITYNEEYRLSLLEVLASRTSSD